MRKYLAIMDASKADSWHRFLLARFNVDYIVKLPTAREIKQVLSNLSIPETMRIDASDPEEGNEHRINEVYDRMLRGICKQPSNTKKFAFRALSWIGYATRTLTKRELLVAISVEANQYRLDDSDMIGFEDLLDYCNGLVIADGQAVRLVHFSVRNYLDRRQVMPKDTKETYRAIACSTYLSFDTLKDHRGYSYKRLNDLHPFLNYAVNNMTFHLSRVERSHYPETTGAVMKLLEDKRLRREYCRLTYRIGTALNIPRLNLACAIGYEDAVRTLLEERDVDVNAKDSTFGLTSISWAILMGNEAVVERLLSVDKVSCDGRMPLSVAIRRRETGIARLLLEKGIEVNFTYAGGSRSDSSRTQCQRCWLAD